MNLPAFPMVARELTVLARAPHVYILRSACAVFAVLPLVWYIGLTVQWADQGISIDTESLGSSLLGVCTYFQLFVLGLVIPLSTAGLLSIERRENTLPLLLMADLRGWDLAASKFCAALVPVLFLILGTLPVMAFAATFGGISVAGAALQILVAISAAIAVGCVGLLCSALTLSPARAFVGTLSVCGIWFVGVNFMPARWTMGGTLYFLNPERAIWTMKEVGFETRDWLYAVVFSWAVAILAAAATFRVIPRVVAFPAVRRSRFRKTRRLFFSMPGISRLIGGAAPLNPLLNSDIFRMIAILILCAVALAPTGLGWVAILCVVSYSTVSTVSAIQRKGVLEDLMITAIDDSALTQELLRTGLGRASLCLIPLALAGGLYLYSLFQWTNLAAAFRSDHLRSASDVALWVSSYGVAGALLTTLLLLQLFCVVSISSFLASYRMPVPVAAVIAMAIYALLYFLACHLPVRMMAGRRLVFVTQASAYDDFVGVLGFALLNIVVFGGTGYLAYRELRDRLRDEFVLGIDAPGEWTPHEYFRRGAQGRTG